MSTSRSIRESATAERKGLQWQGREVKMGQRRKLLTGELPQLKRAAPNPRPLFSPVRVAKWTRLTILLLVRGQGKEQRPIFWEEM
jgi:hypothetical protein